MQHQDISVADFLSVAIYLSEECGKIIRQVEESGDLKTQTKNAVDGPVTIADIKVQKTLEDNFKALYPTLTVEGEESKESTQAVDSALSPDTVTDGIRSFITTDFLNGKQAARADWIRDQLSKTYESDEVSLDPWETFNTKDAVVWIDPLDGTSDFVKGNLPAVTVLIGLSIGGKSRLGIVHNPFSEEDQSVGKTVFGCAEFGTFKIPYNKTSSGEELLAREITQLEHFDHTAEPAEDHKIRVAVTLSHFSDTIK